MNQIKEFNLKNGLNFIYANIPNTGIVSVQIWIKAGSVCETGSNNGISHFLEHILFKGTKNYSPNEIDEIVEYHGGIMNAGTSKDYTTYYITLPSEHAATACKIISDMVFNASFIPDEIEKEKPVVVQEILMKYDNPTYEMWDECMRTVFAPSAYTMEIIGTEENVNSFDSSALKNYYDTHYHPLNMTLIIAGDIGADLTESLANQYFSESKQSPVERTVTSAWQCSADTSLLKTYEKDISQDYIIKAWQVDATAKDAPAYEVLTEVLGGGEYSILNNILKNEKRLVTSVSAGEMLKKSAGAYFFHIVTPPESAQRASDELENILNDISLNGINEHELEKAKNRIMGKLTFVKEKASNLAAEIGYACVIDIKDEYFKYPDLISKITVDDIKLVVGNMLKHPCLEFRTVPLKV